MSEVQLHLISAIIYKSNGDEVVSQVFSRFCVASDSAEAAAHFMETFANSEEGQGGWHLMKDSRTENVVNLAELNHMVAERARRTTNKILKSVS